MRRKQRHLAYFFALSLLLHLALVYLARPPAPDPRAKMFHQPRTTFFDPIKPFYPSKPYQAPTRMERLAAPIPALSAADAALLDLPIAALPATLPPLPDLPDTILVPPKAAFRAPSVELPDLNELADSALARVIAARETFARTYMDDADTTDAESRRRRRAKAVVERAIRAMGGREALLALNELRARVWLEAWDHVEERRDRTVVNNVGTYAYPVATWRYRGFDFHTNRPIAVRPSFDPDAPNPAYLTRNPAVSRDRYDRLFDHRWLFFDQRRRALRQQGEVARWHFLDRFLGHGVVLDYIGAETFDRKRVEVIRVDDRQYGHFFEAFFDQKTALLTATREGLVAGEQRRYKRRHQMQPPVWTTTYTKYLAVHDALLPHRLTRSGPSCPHCRGQSRRQNRTVEVTIQLQIAANGEDPVIEAPDLAY